MPTIETLDVKLRADIAEFERGMSQAKSSLGGLAGVAVGSAGSLDKLGAAGGRTGAMLTGLTSAAVGLLPRLLTVAGLAVTTKQALEALTGAVKVGIAEIEEMGAATRKLSAVFQGNTQSMAGMMALVDDLNKSQPFFEDDQLANAAAGLKMFDLTREEITRLLPVMTDMAAVMGSDLDGAAQKIGLAMAGSTRGLKQWGIVVEEGAGKGEILAAVMAKAGQFHDAAGDAALSHTGKMAGLAKTMKDLSVEMAQTFKPAIDGVVDATRLAADAAVGWARSLNLVLSGLQGIAQGGPAAFTIDPHRQIRLPIPGEMPDTGIQAPGLDFNMTFGAGGRLLPKANAAIAGAWRAPMVAGPEQLAQADQAAFIANQKSAWDRSQKAAEKARQEAERRAKEIAAAQYGALPYQFAGRPIGPEAPGFVPRATPFQFAGQQVGPQLAQADVDAFRRQKEGMARIKAQEKADWTERLQAEKEIGQTRIELASKAVSILSGAAAGAIGGGYSGAGMISGIGGFAGIGATAIGGPLAGAAVGGGFEIIAAFFGAQEKAEAERLAGIRDANEIQAAAAYAQQDAAQKLIEAANETKKAAQDKLKTVEQRIFDTVADVEARRDLASGKITQEQYDRREAAKVSGGLAAELRGIIQQGASGKPSAPIAQPGSESKRRIMGFGFGGHIKADGSIGEGVSLNTGPDMPAGPTALIKPESPAAAVTAGANLDTGTAQNLLAWVTSPEFITALAEGMGGALKKEREKPQDVRVVEIRGGQSFTTQASFRAPARAPGLPGKVAR